MNVFIYALQDPITKEVRYIGKTKNPKMRFYNHMNKRHNEKTHKRNWIESLKSKKLKPIMIIIDEVNNDSWKFWEKYWINQFIVWGFNLVNHTSGGDGLTMGNQTSFKAGFIPWNKGTAKPKLLKYNRGKSGNSVLNQFKKNHIPWNKGLSNYKMGGNKKSIIVLQIDKTTNMIVNEFLGCKEASIVMNCIPENIRRCCVGLSKSAKGYKWKYKHE